MLGRMQGVAVCYLGMVCGLFMIASLVMYRRLAVMFGRMFVMFGRLLVMMVNIAHDALPGFRHIGCSTIARANDADATLLFRQADMRRAGAMNATCCNACRSASMAPVQSPNRC